MIGRSFQLVRIADMTATLLLVRSCRVRFSIPQNSQHSQTHRHTQCNFLNPAHLQRPSNPPGESRKHEIHDDVVRVPADLEVLDDIVIETWPLNIIPILIVALAAVFRPLEETFDDHVDIHGYYTVPENGGLLLIRHSEEGYPEGSLGPCLPNQGST